MNELRELSLFSGYGGFSLGLKLTGIPTRTVMYVEWERYPQEIIKARINDKILDDAPIWGDISTLDGEQLRGVVDIITGGFPCQPHSVAGLKRGADDERNLWPATIRIIREVGPRYVILENVPGILSASRKRGTPAYGGTVVGELAQAGYRVRWETIGADDVGAPHRRKRWLCFGELADSRQQPSWVKGSRLDGGWEDASPEAGIGAAERHGLADGDNQLAYSGHDQRGGWDTLRGVEEEPRSQERTHEESSGRGESPSGFWSERESGDGGTARELADSIDTGNTPRRLHGELGLNRSAQTQEGSDNPLIESGRQERTGNGMDDPEHNGHARPQETGSLGQGSIWAEEGQNPTEQPTGSGVSSARADELADSEGEFCQWVEPEGSSSRQPQEEARDRSRDEELGDSDSTGLQGRQQSIRGSTNELPAWPPSPSDTDGWEQVLRERPDLAPAITKEAESEFRGVANGRSDRVDRLKALGNGLVPSVVTEFLRGVTI